MVPTDDRLFDRVLARNPMEHLEELLIVCSEGLTVRTAYKLIEVCPKLRVLNELEGWCRIHEDELECFKMFIKTNNLDLSIESNRFKAANEELF